MDYVRDNCRKSSIPSFIAGALLPTIAYFLLTRLPGKKKAIEENNMTNIGDECDDDSANSSDFDETDGFIITETGEDPQKWGMKDAPYKMVLCVNQELKMGKGKVAAQCSHAAVGCYKRSMKSSPSGVRAWEDSGCAKIAVKCPLEDEMINSILPKAAQAGKFCHCNFLRFKKDVWSMHGNRLEIRRKQK